MSLNDFDLRARFPRPVKDLVREGIAGLGAATSGMRARPDFLILGGQRCGTTSLYQYLIDHPAVGAALTKEVHFFDNGYDRGEAWYRGHFPSRAAQRARSRRAGSPALTGEATPYYLAHPHAPRRVAELVPEAKLIVMLRDPVDRLISHYHHEVSLGFEQRSLAEALDAEERTIASEERLMRRDPSYVSFAHQHHSYFTRGLYAEQLRSWFDAFPRERFLILETESFVRNTATEFERVLRFLGLPSQGRTTFEVKNGRRYAPADPAVRARLEEAYEPHNRRLAGLLRLDPARTDPGRTDPRVPDPGRMDPRPMDPGLPAPELVAG